MPEDFIIIGTDYGVGKTHVICALLRDLRRRGYNAMGYKPVCCGNRADARAFRDATEPGISLELVNPVYLRALADPLIAAELERTPIDVQQLIAGYHKLKEAGYGPIIIEGIGGWSTPIAPQRFMFQLSAEMKLPIVLLADNRLGAAGQLYQIAADVKNLGLDCRGVILNQKGEEWDTAAVTNCGLIERITGLPVLAELIHGQDDLDSEEILGS